jgi:predicted nucleic acid-binding protein
VILDSGAVSHLGEGRGRARAELRSLVERGWLLVVPTVVLVECLTGDGRRDASVNRVLKAVDRLDASEEADARLAAGLRRRSGNPSVVDALVAARAHRKRGLCIVLTSDVDDLERHVARAPHVRVLGC